MAAKPIVYLAGGIAGLVGYDAVDWREAAAEELRERGIETLNPMRAKRVLSGGNTISRDFHDYEHHGAFFTSQGIMVRDSADVRRCDALLVNLLGLVKPSLGTVMELAWAHLMQKPTVVAIEPTGNPHDGHPMISAAIHFRVPTLAEAVDAVAVVLNR
jgi:nucleoside 2-deoxyribosyltransferase